MRRTVTIPWAVDMDIRHNHSNIGEAMAIRADCLVWIWALMLLSIDLIIRHILHTGRCQTWIWRSIPANFLLMILAVLKQRRKIKQITQLVSNPFQIRAQPNEVA